MIPKYKAKRKNNSELQERAESSEQHSNKVSHIADVNATLPIQEIGDAIEKECEEHITTEGLRFFGTSWAQITRILQKYGFKKEPPF